MRSIDTATKRLDQLSDSEKLLDKKQPAGEEGRNGAWCLSLCVHFAFDWSVMKHDSGIAFHSSELSIRSVSMP